MWTFPTLEPAIVSGGSFVLDRMLDRPGEVAVRVGDPVTPETIVATSSNAEKPMTLFVASELGAPNSSIQRYLTKSAGAKFKEGEILARKRSGLRTVSMPAPADGVLASIDESSGTVVFSVTSGQTALRALVNGEVERVTPERGAVIRASGTRIFGIVGFGGEAVGQLVVGPDRHDRELTPDQVKDAWKGKIVICGMTVGVPALNKLKQAGVAGIIVGSLAEADVRRFLTSGSSSEVRPSQFWIGRSPDASFATAAAGVPFVIVASEGFGRVPMAEMLYSFLRQQAGATVSVQAATCVGDTLRRPEIYITGSGGGGEGVRATDELLPGRPVRLTGGRRLGVLATCASAPWQSYSESGVATMVAEVQLANGEQRVIPVANIEVLN